MSVYNDVFQIDAAIEELVATADIQDADLEQRLHNLFQARADSIQSGADNLCKLRANKQADLAGVETEINRLQVRAKRLKKVIAWAESEIMALYKASGQKKLAAGSFVISTRVAHSVYVQDDFYDPRFMRQSISFEPDKPAIKAALDQGTVIPGATIQTKEFISIK